MNYENDNPVFQKQMYACNEVATSYRFMPPCYKEMFGKLICQEIGMVGTCLKEASLTKAVSSRKRKVEAADHHLQIVKYWIGQAPNLTYITRDKENKTCIPIGRAVCCAASLDEVGRLIGGWLATLSTGQGKGVQQENLDEGI